jgi:hypothetical protein
MPTCACGELPKRLANLSYIDLRLQGEDHSGIEALVISVQQSFPGHRFRLASPVDAYHGRVAFSWELKAGGADPLLSESTLA